MACSCCGKKRLNDSSGLSRVAQLACFVMTLKGLAVEGRKVETWSSHRVKESKEGPDRSEGPERTEKTRSGSESTLVDEDIQAVSPEPVVGPDATPEQAKRTGTHTFPNRDRVNRVMRRYNEVEGGILKVLEVLIRRFDNFVLLQTFIPKLKKLPNTRWGRIVSFLMKQLSGLYVVVIAINLRRLTVRLMRINRVIRQLELQCRILKQNIFDDTQFEIPKSLKKALIDLYAVKIRTIIELAGYVNELVLDLNLLLPKFHLNSKVKKLLGAFSWLISVYRMSQDDDDDTEHRLNVIEKGVA